jgi:ABC-2 type transport system ATP-binding protein
VIDHGKLIHDGDLRQLIKARDPDKRVSFTLTRPIGDDELARLGALLVRDGQRITLRVAEREVAGVIGRLLGELGAADLAIEDPPLEDVLRAMFGEQRRAEAETETKAEAEAS